MYGVVDETACEVLGACMARRFDDEGANSRDRCLHLPELCFQLHVFFLKLPEMCGQSFFRMPPANSVLKLIQVDDGPDTDGEDRTVIFKAASGFQDIRFGDCRRECPDFQRADLSACSVSNRFIVVEGRFEVDPCLFDGFALGTLEDALFRHGQGVAVCHDIAAFGQNGCFGSIGIPCQRKEEAQERQDQYANHTKNYTPRTPGSTMHPRYGLDPESSLETETYLCGGLEASKT